MEKTAKNSALKRLDAREYSAHELLRYLIRKGFELEEAQTAVTGLVSEGLINDTRYSKALAREWAQRGKGPTYMQYKLRLKGIRLSPEEARGLYNEFSEISELDRAKEILRRRYPAYKSDQKEMRRAYQGLLRRGFSGDAVRRAINARAEEEA